MQWRLMCVWFSFIVLYVCYHGALCQRLVVQKIPTTSENCTVSRESRTLAFKGMVITNKIIRCQWFQGTVSNDSAVWYIWWQKVCLYSTKNLNLNWTWIMCKNITIVNCYALDEIHYFCGETKENNKTHKFFKLTVKPLHGHSLTYYKFNFHYANECNKHESAVFQLPEVVGPPYATFVFNNEPGQVLETGSECTQVVHREQMNRFRVCVHNMQNPNLTLNFTGLLSAKVRSNCIDAAGYITIDQLPRTMDVGATDDCGESVNYRCKLKFNPGIYILANNESVYITERTRTCQMFLYEGKRNTLAVCVNHFENYSLRIKLDMSFLEVSVRSYSCVTLDFVELASYQGHLEIVLRDNTSYVLATYFCRHLACS